MTASACAAIGPCRGQTVVLSHVSHVVLANQQAVLGDVLFFKAGCLSGLAPGNASSSYDS